MRKVAEAAGLTQREVGQRIARIIGNSGPLSEQAVGQWYGDKTKPRMQSLVAFAELVKVDLSWLQTGVGKGPGQLPTEGRILPMISSQQARAVPIDYTWDRRAHSYYPCSDKAFVVDLADNRNAPAYEPGYRIVIDPQRKPSPGMMVLALIGENPIFGQYVMRAGRRVEIRALNDNWAPEPLDERRGDRIIGTMTEYAVRV
jgi:SOS-response transcriptional repressor LexA